MSELPITNTPREVTVKCGNCFFAQPETVRVNQTLTTQTVLFCHRYPPRVPDPLSNLPHPMVNPDRDWCGEFLVEDAHGPAIKKPHIEVDENAPVNNVLNQQRAKAAGLVLPQ